MTRIVDTTVRLLSQQPLADNGSTATVLELAEILDGAGFAGLEVSGGGCFDAAIRRGVESPWGRVRALRAGCTKTPVQVALRGRVLGGAVRGCAGAGAVPRTAGRASGAELLLPRGARRVDPAGPLRPLGRVSRPATVPQTS